MRSTWGRSIQYSLFGESHGPAIGITIQHLPAGFRPDLEKINEALARRRPGSGVHATKRNEKDAFELVSGFYEGALTGAPLTALFRNEDTRSGDYEAMRRYPRPSHADYTAFVKYHGFNDPRGGGHFSGRLTAPLVFAGALAAQILETTDDIKILGHVAKLGSVEDDPFDTTNLLLDDKRAESLRHKEMPFLSDQALAEATLMLETLRKAGDSIGGAVEIGVTGLPAGLGDPVFEGIESLLGQLMFSIPAVKAIEFGAGTALAEMRGSEANDPWRMTPAGLVTVTNHSGGINGGITNGMPLLLRVTFRPTPSIAITQQTIDMISGQNSDLDIKGRHDPTVVIRAVPVVEAMTAIGLLEAKMGSLSLLKF
jgi:chorismate synthase